MGSAEPARTPAQGHRPCIAVLSASRVNALGLSALVAASGLVEVRATVTDALALRGEPGIDHLLLDGTAWAEPRLREALDARLATLPLALCAPLWQLLQSGVGARARQRIVQDDAMSDLVPALRALVAGHAYTSPALASAEDDELLLRETAGWELPQARSAWDGEEPGNPMHELRRRAASLSERERAILRGVVAGLKSEAIAHELGIATGTVRRHRENLRSKLSAHNSAQLAAYALALGLVERQSQG